MILSARAAAERGAAGGIGGGDSREHGKRRGDAPGGRDLRFAGCEFGDLQRLLRVLEARASLRAIAGLSAAAPLRHFVVPRSSLGVGPARVIASRRSSSTTGG